MPSLFLQRISVVRVYLYIAVTTPDPAGRDPRQDNMKHDNVCTMGILEGEGSE